MSSNTAEEWYSQFNEGRSLDEELELAQKAKSGDSSAENDLLKGNLYPLFRQACKINSGIKFRSFIKLDDLVQEGAIELITALRSGYNPKRRIRLKSYAIKSETKMLRAAKTEMNPILNSYHKSDILFGLVKHFNDFEFIYERTPDTNKLFDYIKCENVDDKRFSLKIVKVYFPLLGGVVSIDREDREGFSYIGTLSSSAKDPENISSEKDFREKLIGTIDAIVGNKSGFHEKAAEIITYKYGLKDGDNEKTRDQVGNHFGISGQRAEQIEAETFKKIRENPKYCRIFEEYLSLLN